jgi:hypothetical protein
MRVRRHAAAGAREYRRTRMLPCPGATDRPTPTPPSASESTDLLASLVHALSAAAAAATDKFHWQVTATAAVVAATAGALSD